MSYGSLLVHVENGSTSSDARLALAVALADRFDAALIGVAAEAVRPPPVDGMGGALLVGDIMVAEDEQIQADLEAAEQRFRAHPGVQDLETDWRAAVGRPVEVLAREARAADLLVIGRDLERLRAGSYRALDPGEMVMAAGRPVLVVPSGAQRLSADHVLVGWKDAREARRALWDASPFLRAAEEVHVVEVAAEAALDDATDRVRDVVRHLERHAVKARGEVRTQREASAAGELLLVAEQHGADLIVAGAYGHTRLREWVFGGVTRDLLRNSPKCCLLAH
ncbi:universal stress protein [Microvirga massiliensis]|uniref:universal stress protein n=1 Tax=Microvirga massiliensis TaxID=1033741 RepID=UPI00062BE7AE|nr:universal stress protein [Microvirga massiliensis]